MTPNPSFRDIEKLSAYLDGQLKPSESASLESRLASNPKLRDALEELRQARGVLHQLPQRRAPRNFVLSPKMVGVKPPLPRAYPVFRFTSVLATLLLFLSFAANFMAPRFAAQEASFPYGIGGSGGGEGQAIQEPAMALEAPAEQAEPAEPAVMEPEVLEEPAAPEFAAEPTLSTPTPLADGDAFRAQATGMPTLPPLEEAEDKVGLSDQPPLGEEANQMPADSVIPKPGSRPVPVSWQVSLAALALISALILLLLRRNAVSKWRRLK